MDETRTRWCHTVEIQWGHSIFFLHCYTASISIRFNNCWSFERRIAKIWLIRSVLRCTTAPTMTEQSLYLSTTRHPQDVKYKRSTSGALPLASTFKCEFIVGRTMSLSSCESMAGAARQEAASGEPSSGRHNNKLIGSRPSVPCFCNESLLSNSSAPAGCRRAGRAQAGTEQLHPT